MSAKLIHRQSIGATCATVLGALALSLSFAGNALAHGVTLKMQHTQAGDSAFNRLFVEPWKQKIYDESGGRVNILLTPAGEPGSAPDLFQLAQDRGADIVWLTLPGASGEFPRFGLFGAALPGVTSTGSSRALWSWSDVNDLGFREFKELRILAASRHDAPVFHLREKQVASIADLQGLTIGIPNKDGADFLAAIGVNPMVISGYDMRKALTDASVDGVLLSWSSLVTLGLEDTVKAHVEAPAGAPWAYAEVSALLMNPNAYRSLADDLKQVVRGNSGSDTSAWIGKVFDESAAKAREAAAARGATVNALPDADKAAWVEAADAAIGARVKALDERRLRGEKTVAKARTIINENDPAQ